MPQDPNHPPRWDVSNVYPSLDSTEFKADFDLMKTSVDSLFEYLEDHQITKNATGPVQTDSPECVARQGCDAANTTATVATL